VHGEYGVVDDGRYGHTIEAVRECLPQFNVVPPFAFVIESIDAERECTHIVHLAPTGLCLRIHDCHVTERSSPDI
jgi:hypothetical protein